MGTRSRLVVFRRGKPPIYLWMNWDESLKIFNGIKNKMGNDGRNHLTLIGKPASLDLIEQTKAAVHRDGEPDYYETLRTEYFAKGIYNRAKPNKLAIHYDFRNTVCLDYLTDLLKQYPTLWMRNEFDSEEGFCGIDILEMHNGNLDAQTARWTELEIEGYVYRGLIENDA